jgi:uncharacterized membrane protein
MNFVCEVLLQGSAALLGVFAGAMLTEGMVLVPYWRSISPTAFFGWYAANDRRLLRYFGHLTSVTALVVVAAAVLARWTGHPETRHAVASAALMIGVVASFPLYFKRANASFAAASIDAAAVATELARWAAWHWVRTALSVIALFFAMAAR